MVVLNGEFQLERFCIHHSNNVPGNTTARQRLDEALNEYKLRVKQL